MIETNRLKIYPAKELPHKYYDENMLAYLKVKIEEKKARTLYSVLAF